MKPLRVGILGCASIARRYVLPALKSMPEYEIAAIASRDSGKAKSFTAEFGGKAFGSYDGLVDAEKLDVVYIPLPTGLHAEWIAKILQSGKHVMAEKSLAATAGEARMLVDLSREKNLLLMEHFQFLQHRQTAFVQQQIAEGAIGDIRLVRSCFGFPPLDKGNFRYNADLGGGALLDAGAYTLRASQLYLGSRLQVKAALMGADAEDSVDTRGAALLVSEAGVAAEVAWGFDHFYQCSVEIWGQKGRILQDRAFTAPPGYSAGVTIETPSVTSRYHLPPDNHFVNLWRFFHNQVEKGGGFEAHRHELLTQARLLDEVRSLAGWNMPS